MTRLHRICTVPQPASLRGLSTRAASRLRRDGTAMFRRAIVAAMSLAFLSLPPVATAGTTTVVFDDLTPADRTLNGQYPTGVIDWGNNAWFLSGPWGQFTTNSVSF